MRSRFHTLLIVGILVLSMEFVPLSFAFPPNPYAPLVSSVDHAMTIRIALVGFDDVDAKLLTWNLEPSIMPNIQVSSNPQLTSEFYGISYGTSFAVKYDVVTVPNSGVSSLKSYLKSIGSTSIVPDYLKKNYVCACWESDTDPNKDTSSYFTLDATRTETWLDSHIDDFGGVPDDGYTVIVANIADISSMYHYYTMSYHDLDGASSKAKYSSDPSIFPIINWMYSWGGHHRFYYLDLSAGDPQYDYSMVGHVPIQDFATKYFNEKVAYDRNNSTVTEYVADYVAEVIRNLFLPSYVYAPTLADSYDIVINVFDMTGKVTNVGQYVNASKVKAAFEDILPYATWNVTVNSHELSGIGGLATIVSNSIVFSRDVIGFHNDVVHKGYYDYRQIYSYLQTHSDQYYTANNNSMILPVFEFIFKDGGGFAQTWEEVIGARTRSPDIPTRTFGGSTLGDLVIIGSNERDLFAFGYGLTQTTIHELGHMVGLMHPHSFGWTEDYVSSPMSYMTYEYTFSQFDSDAIQRAHADYLISQVQGAVTVSRQVKLQSQQAQTSLTQALSIYNSALMSYDERDYMQAVVKLRPLQSMLGSSFDTEAKGIQERLNQSSVSSQQAKAFLNRAQQLISIAQQQKPVSLSLAYQLLADASVALTDALQEDAQARAFAEDASAKLYTGLVLGIIIGIVVGIAVAWLLLLQRRKHKE